MPTPSADPHETARRLGLVATAAQWQAFGEHLRTIPAFKGDDLVEVLDIDGGGIRFRYSIVDTVPAPSAFATGGIVRRPAPEVAVSGWPDPADAQPMDQASAEAALQEARGDVDYLIKIEEGTMRLGVLQRALEHCPDEEPVRFSPVTPVERANDVDFATPDALESWRGDYAQLALSYATDFARPATAGQVLEWVSGRLAGSSYEGYKGGWYTARAGTEVHVAQWGDTGTLDLRRVSRGRDYRLDGNPMTTWLHVVDTKAEDDDDESEG